MEIYYITGDIFSATIFGGNPLAVFPDVRGLTGQVMQSIAREFNLSECAFVNSVPGNSREFQVRIFTPVAELDFAGHPTVGTALGLAWMGMIPSDRPRVDLTFHERVGKVRVSVFSGRVSPMVAEVTPPRLPSVLPAPLSQSQVRGVLGLDLSNSQEDPRAEIWDCGLPVLVLPVKGIDELSSASVQPALWAERVSPLKIGGVYIYCEEMAADDVLRARFFAPELGVLEDPACGAGALALAGHLTKTCPHENGWKEWAIRQGNEVFRPSELFVKARMGANGLEEVRLRGGGVWVSEGRLFL